MFPWLRAIFDSTRLWEEREELVLSKVHDAAPWPVRGKDLYHFLNNAGIGMSLAKCYKYFGKLTKEGKIQAVDITSPFTDIPLRHYLPPGPICGGGFYGCMGGPKCSSDHK